MTEHKTNPTAILIIIGNEILSGRTRDANLAYLGQRCDELGITLKEARVIQDEQQTIVDVVRHCSSQCDYVFTTGGIGPTHDDITAAAVALAFGVAIERHPDAVTALEQYYPPEKLNEARLKMADIPAGANLLENPVSGAPGFQIENVFVLPGVPAIMQAMFEGMTNRLVGGRPVQLASIKTNLAEGALANGLATIQQEYGDVGIGSYPFFRTGTPGVNLVLRSTDTKQLEAAAARVRELIAELDGQVIGS